MLVYLVLGVFGGATAAVGATLILRLPATLETVTDPFLSATPWIVLGTAIAGGVIAGWLAAALIVSRAPGQVRCPRCGTANDPHSSACDGCSLSF